MGDAVAFAVHPRFSQPEPGPHKWPGVMGKIFRRNTDSQRRSTVTDLVTWGDAANARRDWREAAAYYAATLQLDPSLVATWVQFGHALKEQGLFGLAEAAYRRAVSRGPQSTDALVQLGHFLNRTKQHTEARELFRRAAALDAGLPILRGKRARHFERSEISHLGRRCR